MRQNWLTIFVPIFFLAFGVIFLIDYKKSSQDRKFLFATIFLVLGLIEGGSLLGDIFHQQRGWIVVAQISLLLVAGIILFLHKKKWRPYLIALGIVFLTVAGVSYLGAKTGTFFSRNKHVL